MSLAQLAGLYEKKYHEIEKLVDHSSFILNCVSSKLHLFYADQEKSYIYVNMYPSLYVIIHKNMLYIFINRKN